METKIFTALVLSIFALVLFVGSVSAVTLVGSWDLTADASASFDPIKLTAADLTEGAGVGTLAFDPNGTLADNWLTANATAAILADDYYQVTITPNIKYNFMINSISFSHLTDDVDGTMNFVVRSSEDSYASDLGIGVYIVTTQSTITTLSNLGLIVKEAETITLRIYGYNAASATDVFSIKNLIVSGELIPKEVAQCTALSNTFIIDEIDLSVEAGYGDDEDWFPLDSILAETNIEYDTNDDSKMDNIEVLWGLFDTSNNKWYIDDEEKVSDLDGGEDVDVSITFDLDDDIDDLDSNFVFYMIATGDDEEFSDAETCVYESASVSTQIESDFVILYNIVVPETVQCNEEVFINAEIWNIGDDDQEDVFILVNNKDLGIINERIEIGDVDAFKDVDLDFSFTIPKDAEEKIHGLVFKLYDGDNDIYENRYDDEESKFDILVKVEGNCVYVGEVSVSAELSSGEKAGDDFVITTTITNTGTKVADYIVSAQGYTGWASSASVDQPTFTLTAGESKVVIVTLSTREDVSGEQTFNIEVLSGNEIVMTQPVSVLVEERKGLFSGITGGVIGSGSVYTWTVGTVSVVLFVAIVYVLVKMFRRRKTASVYS